ncbi:LysR family transcriptional regulator [Labrys neptuniae]
MQQQLAANLEQRSLQTSRIDLRYLRYVIAAAEGHSFRRAGAHLNVHPSAISRRVRELESRLGAALFVRTPNGVEVTREGRVFLDRAQPAWEALHAAAGSIAHEACRELRIGVSSAISPCLLFRLLGRLDSHRPAIQQMLFDGPIEDHLTSLRNHQLDVAIVARPSAPTFCLVTPVWIENLFVIVPSHHPLASCPTIPLEELSSLHLLISQDEPVDAIESIIRAGAEGATIAPSIERYGLGRLALMTQIALGRHLGLCGAAATAISIPGIKFCRIAQLPGSLVFKAISLASNNKPCLRRFLQIARELGSATPVRQE